MKFRAIILSPAFNVIRKVTIDAEDEFEAMDKASGIMLERGWNDPNASVEVMEIDDDNNKRQGDRAQ